MHLSFNNKYFPDMRSVEVPRNILPGLDQNPLSLVFPLLLQDPKCLCSNTTAPKIWGISDCYKHCWICSMNHSSFCTACKRAIGCLQVFSLFFFPQKSPGVPQNLQLCSFHLLEKRYQSLYIHLSMRTAKNTR